MRFNEYDKCHIYLYGNIFVSDEYITIFVMSKVRDKPTHCNFEAMNDLILNMLTKNRIMVENRFNEMVALNERVGFPIINSKKFFFKVVFEHFENLSKVMVNKILKSEFAFIRELNKAVEKAEYACAKPAREYSKQFFVK